MADKPILFSGPMVRALLNGSKTQTRRAMNPQPELQGNGLYHVHNSGGGMLNVAEEDVGRQSVDYLRIAVGDRLYVRETFSGPYEYQVEKWPPSAWFSGDPIWYWADGNPEHGDWTRPKPGMHMPRWASRLTLTVTEVRVERLQDISDMGAQNDCTAEGVFHCGMTVPSYEDWHGSGFRSSEKYMYRQIWESINGPGSWDANPWVAAYTFTVERGNIDQLAGRANG